MSRLDYCNSLMYGVNDIFIDRLQKMQNRAARLISLTKPRDKITPILKSLHWLPVRERIEFKIACIIYKCLHDLAPAYLCELIERYIPNRSLRSQWSQKLIVPVCKLVTCEKAFFFGGPKVWNAVLINIKEADSLSKFKKMLKTELFRKVYE